MSNHTLRQLAKGYATGAINKDKYRKSRSELIKGIIDGNIPVKSIDYAPPLAPPAGNDEDVTENTKRNKERTAIKPEMSPSPSPAKKNTPIKPQQQISSKNNEKKFPWIFICLSSVVVIILIIVVILFYPKPPAASKTTTTSTVSASEETAVTDNNKETDSQEAAGEVLIAEFLAEKNWAEESINNLINSWTNLTTEEQESALQTNRMRRMNDSIYKQFLEAKALASIDSEKARMKQEKLIELAKSLGIQDSRLVVE